MNKITIAVLILITSVLMTGCKTPPTRNQLASANYGPKISQSQMLSSVKNYMSSRLIDPSSPTYQCSIPQKAWVKAGKSYKVNATFGTTYYGYYSVCIINAKNRFGGFTGPQEYKFMIIQHNNSPALVHFDGINSAGSVNE